MVLNETDALTFCSYSGYPDSSDCSLLFNGVRKTSDFCGSDVFTSDGKFKNWTREGQDCVRAMNGMYTLANLPDSLQHKETFVPPKNYEPVPYDCDGTYGRHFQLSSFYANPCENSPHKDLCEKYYSMGYSDAFFQSNETRACSYNCGHFNKYLTK